MIDPVSVGAAVAVLAARKVFEGAAMAAGDQVGDSGWRLGGRVLEVVRGWFAATDADAEASLAAVEAASNPSEAEVADLAALIDARLPGAPRVAAELEPLLAAARADAVLGPILGPGAASQVGGNQVNITTGDRSIASGGDTNITINDPRH